MLLTKFISEINGKTAPEAKAAISGKTNAEAILKVLEDLKTKLMENPKNTEEATIIKDLKVLMKQVNKIVEVEKAGQEIIAKAEPPLKEPTKKVAPVEKAAVQEVNSTPGRRL